jgi:hypothetical protein
MIDFFDQLYNSITNKNKLLNKIKFYSFLRFFIRLSANIIIPVYFNITKYNKKYTLEFNASNQNPIIVSLTSFPNRISKIWLVIETILRQTKKPDKIILWLSKDQFSSVNLLPKKLLNQRLRGLEIRLVEGDIRSHKKYYYTLLDYPFHYMLTIDDDILYRLTMIEDMVNYSIKYPSAIISQYCKKIVWVKANLESYISWPLIKKETFSKEDLFYGTGGGTLFPPNSLAKYNTLNSKLFMSLSPFADDVWLNTMSRIQGTLVVKTSYSSLNLPIMNFKNTTLNSKNIDEGLNDKQLQNVRHYYIEKYNIDPFSNQLEINQFVKAKV